MKNMNYNLDYFIKKFEEIPEEKWCVGSFRNKQDQCCALGHCGVKAGNMNDPEEAHALKILMYPYYPVIGIVAINDGLSYGEPTVDFTAYGSTPKQRILKALTEIKEGKVSKKE